MSDSARNDHNARRRAFYRARVDWERRSDGYPIGKALDALHYAHTEDGARYLDDLDLSTVLRAKERGYLDDLDPAETTALLDAIAKTVLASDLDYEELHDVYDGDDDDRYAWETRGADLTALAATGFRDKRTRDRLASTLDPDDPITRDPAWVRGETHALLELSDALGNVRSGGDASRSARFADLREVTTNPDHADAVKRVRGIAGMSVYTVDAEQVCGLMDGWSGNPDVRDVGIDMLQALRERVLRRGSLRTDPEERDAIAEFPRRLVDAGVTEFPLSASLPLSRDGVRPHLDLMDEYGTDWVVAGFRDDLRGWDARRRRTALADLAVMKTATMTLDDAWGYASKGPRSYDPKRYDYLKRVSAFHDRVPASLVPALAVGTEPVDDTVSALDTFRMMNADGGFPFALAAAGLGVPDDAMTDDEWNAWCDVQTDPETDT